MLLGCDFHMDGSQPYCHSAGKGDDGVLTNNKMYGILSQRFSQLLPVFEDAGLTIVNATVGSRLDVWDRVELSGELDRSFNGNANH